MMISSEQVESLKKYIEGCREPYKVVRRITLLTRVDDFSKLTEKQYQWIIKNFR